MLFVSWPWLGVVGSAGVISGEVGRLVMEILFFCLTIFGIGLLFHFLERNREYYSASEREIWEDGYSCGYRAVLSQVPTEESYVAFVHPERYAEFKAQGVE